MFIFLHRDTSGRACTIMSNFPPLSPFSNLPITTMYYVFNNKTKIKNRELAPTQEGAGPLGEGQTPRPAADPSPSPRPRLTVLQRGGAVAAAPAQAVPSLLAGFLPLLLLCGIKAQRVSASDPGTPSPAAAGQGVGWGQPQGAGLPPAGGKDCRFQFMPTRRLSTVTDGEVRKVGLSPGLHHPRPRPHDPASLLPRSLYTPAHSKCLWTRLTFLGHLPKLKGNFEGLGYCEGDSLSLKNRK